MTEMRDQRIKEIEEQRPGDLARVESLLERHDALEVAILTVGDDEEICLEEQEEVLEVLRVMLAELNTEFERSREGLGLPD